MPRARQYRSIRTAPSATTRAPRPYCKGSAFSYTISDGINPDSTTTVSITVGGINDAPEVTPPGIPDLTIFTSNPTVTVPLFPHFEDADHTDDQLSYGVSNNSNLVLVQTPVGVGSADGLLVVTTPGTLVGSADLEVTAIDPLGESVTDTFTVTVVDDVPPVISGHPNRLIFNAAPGAPDTFVNYGPVTALDKVDGVRPVSCVPASETLFAVGAHTVTCTASDVAGNPSMVSFEVLVVATRVIGVGEPIAAVSIRDEAAPDAGTFNTYQQIYLNDAGEILLQATATGGRGVWTDAGTPGTLGPVVALQGGAAGALGTFSNFSNLALSDSGQNLFMANLNGHFVGGANVAVGGAAAPGGGNFKVLYQAALAGDHFVTAANLDTTFAGTTPATDTGLWGIFGINPNQNVVREGDAMPSSVGVAGGVYGQISPRVVLNSAGQIAFSANLVVTAGVTLGDNTAVFSGEPPAGASPGTLAIVAREGSPAPGAAPNEFLTFASESINSSGEIAFRASVRAPSGDTTVLPGENQGLWTNIGGLVQLVAREGAVAPCPPSVGVLFDRFAEVFVTDTSEVHFRAFLKGAGVTSGSDESLWRYAPGVGLHIVVREGDVAPGTGDAPIRDFQNYAVSEAGLVAYTARFKDGAGDVDTSTNQGLFTTDSSVGIPVLRVRKNDIYQISPLVYRAVTEISLSRSANASGGTGGYGRVINDTGETAFHASMKQNSSGVFVLVP